MKKTYYLFSSGTLVRNDNTLRLKKNSGEKIDIPIESVYDIMIFSEISINSKLLYFLSQKGVCLHFFNYYGFYSGTYYAKEKNVSGNLLIHQVEFYQDIEKRLILAKKLVIGAANNILKNLKYYNARGKVLSEYINNIKRLSININNCTSVNEVMGIEGNIRKLYYESWNIIIDQEIDFNKRVKRPPDNMINSLISFLNSVFYTKCLSEIYITQLNPTISYLHEPFEKRFSLALDISEVFKPIMVDRLIFTLFNKNIISDNDFIQDTNYLKLKESTSKKILQMFDERLSQPLKHKLLNKYVSYRQLIRLELYKLIKHLIGDKEYTPFTIWW